MPASSAASGEPVDGASPPIRRHQESARPKALAPRAMVMGVVLVGAAVCLPLFGVAYEYRATSAVAQARIAQFEMQQAIAAAHAAESAIHGYVLSGDAGLLVAFEGHREEFRETTARLQAMVEGDEHTATRVEQSRLAFEGWNTTGAAALIRLTETENTSESEARRAEAAAIAAFRTFGREGQTVEQRLDVVLSSRIDARRTARVVMLGLIGGGVVCAVFVSLTFGSALLAREFDRRRMRALRLNLRSVRRALQREEQVNLQRSQALSIASHDLRSPIAGLLLAADLIRLRAEQEGHAEYVELASEMVDAARRTTMMVADLLDDTRVEAGQLELSTKELRPERLLDEALADALIGRSRRAFHVGRDVIPDLLFRGDEVRLRAVIRNLLENAFRYGQPPYRLRVVDDPELVEIHVEDAGAGVEEREREYIFQRFRRGSTSRGTEGTGIGLHLARSIVELHGGQITVGKSPLGGADFVVRLPKAARRKLRTPEPAPS